jgi:hypothetical protein
MEAVDAPVQELSAKHARSFDRVTESGSVQWDDAMEVHVRLGALAVGWRGANRERWLQRVLESAAASLRRGAPSVSVGWRLLLAALGHGEPRAHRLAEDHAPQTPALARQLLEMVRNGYLEVVPSWIAMFVNDHAAWFPPGWLRDMRLRIPDGYPVPTLSALWARAPLSRIRVQVDDGLGCDLVSVDAASHSWSLLLPSTMPDSSNGEHGASSLRSTPNRRRTASLPHSRRSPYPRHGAMQATPRT